MWETKKRGRGARGGGRGLEGLTYGDHRVARVCVAQHARAAVHFKHWLTRVEERWLPASYKHHPSVMHNFKYICQDLTHCCVDIHCVPSINPE